MAVGLQRATRDEAIRSIWLHVDSRKRFRLRSVGRALLLDHEDSSGVADDNIRCDHVAGGLAKSATMAGGPMSCVRLRSSRDAGAVSGVWAGCRCENVMRVASRERTACEAGRLAKRHNCAGCSPRPSQRNTHQADDDFVRERADGNRFQFARVVQREVEDGGGAAVDRAAFAFHL